jgi:hypothetical protein
LHTETPFRVRVKLRGTGKLTRTVLPQANAYAMIRRRADADATPKLICASVPGQIGGLHRTQQRSKFPACQLREPGHRRCGLPLLPGRAMKRGLATISLLLALAAAPAWCARSRLARGPSAVPRLTFDLLSSASGVRYGAS